MTTEEFIQRCKSIHGDKYLYTKSVYHGCFEKIEVECPYHGSFYKLAGNHYLQGCPVCSGAKKYNKPIISGPSIDRAEDGKLDSLRADYIASVDKNIAAKTSIFWFKAGVICLCIQKSHHHAWTCHFLPDQFPHVLNFVMKGTLDGGIWTSTTPTLQSHWTKRALDRVIGYTERLNEFPTNQKSEE